MVITEQTDGWTYAAQPLSTPDDAFGEFASAVAAWRAKSCAGTLPRKRDIRPEDLLGWLGWVIVYEVVPEPFNLRFRLFGSSLADGLGLDHTGKLFSVAYAHVPGHAVALRHFHYLWQQRKIGIASGPMNWEGRGFRSGVFVDLPVAGDDGAVGYFLTFSRLICAPPAEAAVVARNVLVQA